jgi:single-strand DNA-binding protein
MGRLTKDVELRHGNNGMAFASFTLAVNRAYKKEGEERQADFISCKAFGKTAEFLNNYFAKGSLVAIEGHIQTGSYEKDGTKVYTTDVIVDKVHFTGGKSNGQGEQTGQAGFTPVDISDSELPF